MLAGQCPLDTEGNLVERGDVLGQVDQVVACEWLRLEMRMHEPHAAESPGARATRTQIGQIELMHISDDDVLDGAATVDQNPDLTLNLPRTLAEKARQLG